MKKNRAPKTSKTEEKVPKAAKPARAKKPKACQQRGCKKPGTSFGYCRLHYLTHWKGIKQDERQRAERRLNAYVDRLAKRYPDEYLEKIKEGIENEDAFKKTMEQLELDKEHDQGNETEREFLEKLIRNIKHED